MRLTSFQRLRNAAANLDMHYIAESIMEVKELLHGEGLPLNPSDVAITEEGIYYIHPSSGMAAKVALYMSNLELDFSELPVREIGSDGYDDWEMTSEFPNYHLVRCNILSQIQRDEWQGDYHILQRSVDTFPLRLYDILDGDEVYQTIDNQKLTICPFCLTKINSLLGKDAEYTSNDFTTGLFFDAGFQATWKNKGGYSRDRGVLADVHPKDWSRISKRRKKQASYLCEQCNKDLSDAEDRNKLKVHHADHLSDKVSYTRLKCVCKECLADLPGAPKKKKQKKKRQSTPFFTFEPER